MDRDSIEYDKKLLQMKSYLPFLENMERRLKTASGDGIGIQLSKIQGLKNLLLGSKRMKMENLRKCEQVLIKLHQKTHEKKSVESSSDATKNVLEECDTIFENKNISINLNSSKVTTQNVNSSQPVNKIDVNYSTVVSQMQAASSPVVQMKVNSSPVTGCSANSSTVEDYKTLNSSLVVNQIKVNSSPVVSKMNVNSSPAVKHAGINSLPVAGYLNANFSPVASTNANSSPAVSCPNANFAPVAHQMKVDALPLVNQIVFNSSPATIHANSPPAVNNLNVDYSPIHSHNTNISYSPVVSRMNMNFYKENTEPVTVMVINESEPDSNVQTEAEVVSPPPKDLESIRAKLMDVVALAVPTTEVADSATQITKLYEKEIQYVTTKFIQKQIGSDSSAAHHISECEAFIKQCKSAKPKGSISEKSSLSKEFSRQRFYTRSLKSPIRFPPERKGRSRRTSRSFSPDRNQSRSKSKDSHRSRDSGSKKYQSPKSNSERLHSNAPARNSPKEYERTKPSSDRRKYEISPPIKKSWEQQPIDKRININRIERKTCQENNKELSELRKKREKLVLELQEENLFEALANVSDLPNEEILCKKKRKVDKEDGEIGESEDDDEKCIKMLYENLPSIPKNQKHFTSKASKEQNDARKLDDHKAKHMVDRKSTHNEGKTLGSAEILLNLKTHKLENNKRDIEFLLKEREKKANEKHTYHLKKVDEPVKDLNEKDNLHCSVKKHDKLVKDLKEKDNLHHSVKKHDEPVKDLKEKDNLHHSVKKHDELVKDLKEKDNLHHSVKKHDEPVKDLKEKDNLHHSVKKHDELVKDLKEKDNLHHSVKKHDEPVNDLKEKDNLHHSVKKHDEPVKDLKEKDNLHHSVKHDETNKDVVKIDKKEVKHSIKPFKIRTPEVVPVARVKSIPKISLIDTMADIITSEIKLPRDQTETLVSNVDVIGQISRNKDHGETLTTHKSTSHVENKTSELDIKEHRNNIQEDILKALADDSMGNLSNLNEDTDVLFRNNSLQNVVSQKSRRISLETYKEKHLQASPGNFNLNKKISENINKYVDIVNRVFTAKELERFNPFIKKAVESKRVTSDLTFKVELHNKPSAAIIQHEQRSSSDLQSPTKHAPIQLTNLLQLKVENERCVSNSNIKMNNARFRSMPSQDMNNLPPWATPSQRPSDFNQPVKHVYSGACTYSLNGSPGLDLFSPKSEDNSFIGMTNLQSASRMTTPNVSNFNSASAEMQNMINPKAKFENSPTMWNFNPNSENSSNLEMAKLQPTSRLMSPNMMSFNAGSAEQINAANSEYEVVHQHNRCEPLNSPNPYGHIDFPVSSNYKGKNPKPFLRYSKNVQNQSLRAPNVISPDFMRDPNHIVSTDMNIISNAGYQHFNDRMCDVAKSYNQDPQSDVGFPSRMGRGDFGNYMNEIQFGSPSGSIVIRDESPIPMGSSQISMRFNPKGDERCTSISDSRGYSMHRESGSHNSNEPYTWRSQQREQSVGRTTDRVESVTQNFYRDPSAGRTFQRRPSVGQNFQREPSVGRTFNREQGVGRTYQGEQGVGRSFYQDPVGDFSRNQNSCSRSFREASIGRTCNFESNEVSVRFGNPSSRFQRAQSVGRLLNPNEDRCMDRSLSLYRDQGKGRAREGSVGRLCVRGKSVGPASFQDVDYRWLNPESKFQRGQSVGRSLHIFKEEINSDFDPKIDRFRRGRSVGRFTEISKNHPPDDDRNKFKKDNRIPIFSHSNVDERTALFNNLKTQQIAFNKNENKNNRNVIEKERSIKDPRLRHLQEKELESKKTTSKSHQNNERKGSNKDSKNDRRTEKYSDPRRSRIDSKHDSRNHRKQSRERDSSKSSRRSKNDNSKSRDDKSRSRSSAHKESFSKSKNSMLNFRIPKLKKDEVTESTKPVDIRGKKHDIDERKLYFIEKIPETKTKTTESTSMDENKSDMISGEKHDIDERKLCFKEKISESKTTTTEATSMDEKKSSIKQSSGKLSKNDETVSDLHKINECPKSEILEYNLKDEETNRSTLNDDLKNESPQKNGLKKIDDLKDEVFQNVSKDDKLNCSIINKDSRIESSECDIEEEKSNPIMNTDSNEECLENDFNCQNREDIPQVITDSKENNVFKNEKRLSYRSKIKDHFPDVDLTSDRKLRDRSKINKNLDSNYNKEKRPTRLSKVSDSDLVHEKSPVKNKSKKAAKKNSVESNKPDADSTKTSDPVSLMNVSNSIDLGDAINILNPIDAANHSVVNTRVDCPSSSSETKDEKKGLAINIESEKCSENSSKNLFENFKDAPLPSKDNKDSPTTSPDDVEQSQTFSEKVCRSPPKQSEKPIKQPGAQNNPKERNEKGDKGISDINSLVEILKNKNKMLEILELLSKTEDQTVSNKIRKRIEKLAEIESDDEDNSDELSIKDNTKTGVRLSVSENNKETVVISEASVEAKKTPDIAPNAESSVPGFDVVKSPETGDKSDIASSQMDKLNKNNVNIVSEELEITVQKSDILPSQLSNEVSIDNEAPLKSLEKTNNIDEINTGNEASSDVEKKSDPLNAVPTLEATNTCEGQESTASVSTEVTKPKRKYTRGNRELEMLHEYNLGMFISQDVLKATGVRTCTMSAEMLEKKNDQEKKNNVPKKGTKKMNARSPKANIRSLKNKISTTEKMVIAQNSISTPKLCVIIDKVKTDDYTNFECRDVYEYDDSNHEVQEYETFKQKPCPKSKKVLNPNTTIESNLKETSSIDALENQTDPLTPSSDLPVKPNRFRKCKLANNLNSVPTQPSNEIMEGEGTTLTPEVINNDIKSAKKIKKQPILSLKDESSKKTCITAKPTIRKKKKCIWKTGVIRKKPIKKGISGKLAQGKPAVNYIDKSYNFSPDKFEYQCKLCCKYKGLKIISHFKTEHPHSEVFISRLHPEQAKLAVDESKLCVNEVLEEKVSKKFKQYRCRFCMYMFKVKNLRSVFEHIAQNHTGEYKCECSLCASNNLVSCVSVCNRSSTLPPVFDGNNSVKGFICSLCNYTQLSHENLKTHIALRHFHKECELIEINLTQRNARRRRSHAQELAGLEKRNNTRVSAISEKTDKESDCPDDVHSSKSVIVTSIEEPRIKDTLLLQTFEKSDKDTTTENSGVFSATVQQSEPKELPINLQFDNEVNKIPEVPIKKEIICHEHDSVADASNTPESSLLEVKEEVPIFEDEPSVTLINDLGQVPVFEGETSVSLINNSVRAQTPTVQDLPENVKKEVLSPVKTLDIRRDYVQVGAIQRKHSGDSSKYVCFINNCTFTSQFLFIFSRHLDEHHADDKWDGFCSECGKHASNSTSQRFEYELALDHLIRVHVKDGNIEINETRNVDTITSDLSPKNPFISKIQVRPMTDLMTVSDQTEMSKDIEEDPLISETGICHLRIENVVSLNPNLLENQRLAENSEATVSSPSGDKEMLSPIPPPPPLKCAPTERVIISKRKLLQSSSSSRVKIAPKPQLCNPPQLVAANPKIIKYNTRCQQLFKCSTDSCSFSTSQMDEYTEHLIMHERIEGVIDWNACMYCEFLASVPHQLAHHVLEEHGACRFECPQCSYRAAAPVLVMTHSVAMHRTRLSAIGEVHTHPDAAKGALIRGLLPKRACIKPYTCTYDYEGVVCRSQFYTSDHFHTHLQQHKRPGCNWLCSECEPAPDAVNSEPPVRYSISRLLAHLRAVHNFKLLVCAFCAVSYESQAAVLGHLALKHPSRRPLLYLRVWEKPKEVGVLSDKVVLLNLDKPELYKSTIVTQGVDKNSTYKKATPELTPFEFQEITSIEKASEVAANVTTSDDRWEIAVINSASIDPSLETLKPVSDDGVRVLSKQPSSSENSHLISDDVSTKAPPSSVTLTSPATSEVTPIISAKKSPTKLLQVSPNVSSTSTVKPDILLQALQRVSPVLTSPATVLKTSKETVNSTLISKEIPTILSETSLKRVTSNDVSSSLGKRTLLFTKVHASVPTATVVKPTSPAQISTKSADKMTSVLKPCLFNPFGLKNNSFNEPPVTKADEPPVNCEENDVDVINLDSDDDVPLAITKTGIDHANQIANIPSEIVQINKIKIVETPSIQSDREPNLESDYSVEFLSDDEAAVVSALIGEEDSNTSQTESQCFTTMSESVMMKVSKNTGLFGKDLFRCGNYKCKYSLENSSEFKDHLAICQNAKEQNKLSCFHCNRKFKHNMGLLDHVRMHGTHRYQCNICFHLSYSSQSVVSHMRKAHKTTVTHVVPVNPFKTNDDTDFFIVKASENIATSKGKRKKSGPKSYVVPAPVIQPETPTKLIKDSFGPDEIDNLPWNPILTYEISCAVCGFGTKVRSNMLRHLQMHSNEIAVPSVAPINPVPHLESNEMHFDKMANLALSSNIDRPPQVRSSDKKERSDLAKPFMHSKNVPQFIPEKDRFVCGSKSCCYISVDEIMLRYHWEALHREETVYHCTHCGEHVSEGNRALSTAHIASHLRLHEESLIGCEHCSFIHPQTRVVERHSLDAHGRSSSRCLRSLPGTTPAPCEPGEMELRSWHCSLCPTKTTFKSEIITHSKNIHSARNQYKCALCPFSYSTRNFDAHFASKHPNRPVDIQTMYTRGDEPLPVDNSPLWWKQRKRGSTFTEEVPSSPEPNKPEQPPLKKKRTSIEAGEIVKIKEEKISDLEILSASTPKTKVDEIKIALNTKLLNTRLSSLKNVPDIIVPNKPQEKVLKQTDLLAQNIKNLKNPPAKVAEEITSIKQEFPSTSSPVNHNIIQILPTFGEPKEDNFSCPFCDKFTSKSSSEMKIHFYEEMNFRPFVCPVCAYKSFNETRILEHSKETHGTAQAQIIIGDPKVELWVTDCLLAQTKSINAYLAKRNTKTPQVKTSVPDEDNDSSSDERLVIVEVDKSKALEASPRSQSPSGSATLVPPPPPPFSPSRPDTPSQPFTAKARLSPAKQNMLSALSPKKVNKLDKSKCPYCDFESHSGIRIHIMRHWKVKPLKCGYCDFTAIRRIELRPHITRIHFGEPYLAIKSKLPEIQEIIQVGNKKIPPKSVLNARKPYMCLKCEHSLDLEEITEHVVLCHGPEKDSKIMLKKSIVYKCIMCMQLTPDIPSVMEHCKREHPNQEMNYVMHKLGNPKSKRILAKDSVKIVYKYSCQHCQVKAQSFCELLDHHKNLHPGGQIYIKPLEFSALDSTGEIKTTLAPGVNECFIQGCEALLPNPTALKFHLRSHYMVYSCECLLHFHTYRHYLSHVQQHSGATSVAMKHTFTSDLILHDRLMQLFSLFKSLNSSFPGHYKDFIFNDEDDADAISSSQTEDSDCVIISDSILDDCGQSGKPARAKSQVARKSTTNVGGLLKRLLSSDDDRGSEELSYYKSKPAALNLKKIKVEMLFLEKLRSFSVEKLSTIENINPIVLVKDYYN